MFCSKCGSMMFPRDGKYVCQCGEVQELGKAECFTTDSMNKETAVIDEKVAATLPKTRIICPECGNTEAYYVLMQTRSADEPETRMYRCTKCNHAWREY